MPAENRLWSRCAASEGQDRKRLGRCKLLLRVPGTWARGVRSHVVARVTGRVLTGDGVGAQAPDAPGGQRPAGQA